MQRRGREVSEVFRQESAGVGEKCREIVGAVIEKELPFRLGELVSQPQGNPDHQLFLHAEQIAKASSRELGAGHLPIAQHHRGFESHIALCGNVCNPLNHSARPRQPANARRGRRIDTARL